MARSCMDNCPHVSAIRSQAIDLSLTQGEIDGTAHLMLASSQLDSFEQTSARFCQQGPTLTHLTIPTLAPLRWLRQRLNLPLITYKERENFTCPRDVVGDEP